MLIKCNKLLLHLLLVHLFFSIKSNSQRQLKIPTKLFTTYNTKFSIAVGGDLSYDRINSNNVIMYPIKSVGKLNDDNFVFREIANWSAGVGLDIYAPLSLISFYIGAEFNSQKYVIKESLNNKFDRINNWNIEVPLYIKFRFGKPMGISHWWLALGAGYSIPLQTELRYTLDNNSLLENNNNDFFKSIPYTSVMIGYEVYLQSVKRSRNNLRILIYLKGNYDLDNRVNLNTVFPDNSVLSELNNLDIQFLRLSIGLKFLLF